MPRFGLFLQALDPVEQFPGLVRQVEEAGFEVLFIADSSLHAAYCYTYLTLAAEHSRRLRIGTGITHPYTRHPAVNVNAAATIDQLSGGRFILGVGAGDRPVTELGYRAAPVDVVREMIVVARRLLAGETVDYESKSCRLRGARLFPFGGRPNLPIYIAASGPRMLALAGELADGVVVQGAPMPAAVAWAWKQIEAGAARSARSLDGFDFGWIGYGAIGPDREAMRDEARPIAAWFAQTAPVYCELAGIDPEAVARIRQAYAGGHLEEAKTAIRLVTPQMLDRLGFGGTPDELHDRAQRLFDAGVQTLYFLPLSDNPAVRWESVRQFARLRG